MAREPKYTLQKRLNKIIQKHPNSKVHKVKGRQGDIYTVLFTKRKNESDSEFVCNCLGYTYHKKCWHSKYVSDNY